MERIVGKLAIEDGASYLLRRSRWGRRLLWTGLVVLLGWGIGRAEAASPVLQKVFVYAGEDRIRLVALFDKPLRQSAPQPLPEGDGLSFFLEGARGGRELRHFVVGQGGYRRVEAEERQDGLRLTVRGEQPLAHLKSRLGVTASGSALTLTLPSLAGANLQLTSGRKKGRETDLPPVSGARAAASKSFLPLDTAASSPPEGKVREARREPLTPESILRQSLTAGAVRPALSAEARPAAAAAPRAAPRLPAPFGPNEAEAAPAPSRPLTPADLGAGAPSLTGLMVQMAAALGGLLALLLGGLAAFKKWGAGAVDRLGAGGKVVRTLHRVYLAPKQSIALVEVAGEILVIGVSGQSISMLTKIENQAALAKLRSGGEASFVEQLARLMGGKEKSPALPTAPDTAAPAPSIAALKAYAESIAAKETARPKEADHPKQNSQAAARPARALAEAPARPASGIPLSLDQESGAKKAVARLRERLGRVPPQWTASGAVS